MARVSGEDLTAAPEVAWAVEGTEVATVVCAAPPAADGAREECETTFAVDEVVPRTEVVRDAPRFVLFAFVNLNDWPSLPEQATLTLAWAGGEMDEHVIELADEDSVESGNECPQWCRTGLLELDGAEGGG